MKPTLISNLRPGMLPAQTIYDSKGLILVARGVALTESYIKRLTNFNITSVIIQNPETENKYAAVLSPIAGKAARKTPSLIAELSEHKTVQVEGSAYKIEQVMYAALERLPLQPHLERISHNQTLYMHSLRATLLSIIIGLAKNYDYLNLDFLATCALLHDCGMKEEFLEDNLHAFNGFLTIRDEPELDILTALVCLQHHERFDGLGTPLGFCKYQITEFARIIAIADYYDRLIMENNTPRQAVFKLVAGSGTLFDPDILKIFESTLIS